MPRNPLAYAAVLEVARRAGLSIHEKSGETKLYASDAELAAKSKSIAVVRGGKDRELVTRIYFVSKTEFKHATLVPMKTGYKTIRGQLDLNKDAPQEDLFQLIRALKGEGGEAVKEEPAKDISTMTEQELEAATS